MEFEETIDDLYLAPPGSTNSGPVFLVKENDVVSEQTFVVTVQVSSSVPPSQPSIQPATLGEDYSVGSQDITVVTSTFLASQQRLAFSFTLFPDETVEETEAFLATSAVGDQSTIGSQFFVPRYLAPITTTRNAYILIEDDDGEFNLT